MLTTEQKLMVRTVLDEVPNDYTTAAKVIGIPRNDLMEFMANDPEMKEYAPTSSTNAIEKSQRFVQMLEDIGIESKLARRANKMSIVSDEHFNEIISMSAGSTIGPMMKLIERLEKDFDILDEGGHDPEYEAVLRTSINRGLEVLNSLANSTQKWAKDRAELDLRMKELIAREDGFQGKMKKGNKKAVIDT